MKIIKNNIDDETCEITIDRKGRAPLLVAYLTHDEHGWAGMRAVEEAIETVAKAAGIEIEEIFE
jgi:hypothetical protein